MFCHKLNLRTELMALALDSLERTVLHFSRYNIKKNHEEHIEELIPLIEF